MLHLLGRGKQPEWDEEKHDIDEVFAFLCYRGIHYAKWVYLDIFHHTDWNLKNPREEGGPFLFFCVQYIKVLYYGSY